MCTNRKYWVSHRVSMFGTQITCKWMLSEPRNVPLPVECDHSKNECTSQCDVSAVRKETKWGKRIPRQSHWKSDTENNLSGEREWEQTETSYKWLEFHCNCKCTTNFLRFKGYFHTCSSFRLGCISWWLCKFVAFCLWQWLLSHTVNFRLTTQCHYEPREKILLACWPDVSEAEATTKSRRSRRSFSVVVCWTTSGQFY